MNTVDRGLVCVSVAAVDAAAVIASVRPVLSLADVVEIRLDAMLVPQIEPCVAALDRPLLVTNRPRWEGGLFAGNEAERVDQLCAAVQAGARYVDIELRTNAALRSRLIGAARDRGARVIVSSHDFAGTPPAATLLATLHQMRASGADLGKIVTTATNADEALCVLAVQGEAKTLHFPLSAFAMGEPGRITRLASLYLGGAMTYASLDEHQATAPGQLSVCHLRALITLFEQRP